MKKLKIIFTLYILAFQAWGQQNDTIVLNKQKEVFRYLKEYHYCQEGFTCINHISLTGNKLDYSNESKNRLFFLLKGNWLEAELDSIARKKINNQLQKEVEFVKMIINDTIKYRFKKNQRVIFHDRLDSLIMVKNKKNGYDKYFNIELVKTKKYLMNKKVADEIVLICGLLGEDQYLTHLKSVIEDSIKYDQNIVSLVLARNKIDDYYKNLIRKYSIYFPRKPRIKSLIRYNILRDYQERSSALLYICTQKSIKELAKWLEFTDTEYKIEAISHSDIFIPIANYAAKDIIDIIKNKDFRSHFVENYSITSLKSEDIQYVKKWLNANFGNYELDKTCLPKDLGKLTYVY